MIFQILVDEKPATEVAYPTFARAAAVWKESGHRGRVVELNVENQIVREFSAQESEKAALIYSKPI
jgi:hypothetical protein